MEIPRQDDLGLAIIDRREASLFGFVWVFKFVRYSAGLTILQRVISNARHALLSVLLGLVIILLAAASIVWSGSCAVDGAIITSGSSPGGSSTSP